MSSKQQNERKVLRIGIIQGGKIIEERTLKKRETVSVGSSEKAMFTVNSPSFPKSIDLFEIVGGEYLIRFTPDMSGVVQLKEGDVNELAQLQARPEAKKAADATTYPITDDSRGKVKVGDVTVLFQFRAAPAAAGKSALPPEVRGTFISNIDTQFATILTIVLISIVSLAAYARQFPYIEPTNIEDVAERYQKLIMPDRDPAPLPEEAPAEDAADQGKEKEKEVAKEAPKKSKAKGEKSEVDEEAAARARKEAMKKAVAGKGLLGVIGTKGKNGALQDVFNEGGFGEDELGSAFSGIQGVDLAGGGGARGTRGGGAGEATSLGSLATGGGGNVSVGGKSEKEVRGTVGAEAPSVEGDLSPAVIAREMRRHMRAVKDCYERQLKRFPQLAGKIVISFEIREAGTLTDINIEEDSLKNSEVRSCIVSRAKGWRFPRPSGGSVFVSFPLVFTPAG